MNNLVSVVITCYNHEEYIRQCIESVFNQSYRNIELIIINDGSSDRSEQIIEDALKVNPFKKTTYIYQKNQGICATRNRCLELINGDFVLFVDSDNYLEANFVEEMLKTAYLENADIIYTSLKDIDSGEVIIPIQKFNLEKYFIGNHIDNCSLIRVSKIENQRYDLNLNRKKLVDYDFFLGLILYQNAKPAPCDSTFLNYRKLVDSISEHGNVKKYSDAYLYIMMKYSAVQPEFSKKGLATYIDNLSTPQWLQQECLLIYLSEDSSFKNFTVQFLSLNKSGTELIHIPKTCKKFRLDFSELPIIVKFISVKLVGKDTHLLPEFTNGIEHLSGYIFGKNDPQLLYDISSYEEDLQVEVSYELEIETMDIIRSVGQKLDDDVKALKSLKNRQEQTLLQNRELENRLSNLQHEYNNVVTSRRWIIATKLINFFRRK
ncbi:glycosyltransferase family 2 protein [Streptococcus suis]|uniref:glycosyltransferase family 2 protein n=1 Tax=Streptococcus suis TaxID=1307 RepID=UPI002117BF6D|nr:glycosyltransferase family 2 protein [Streptococcus suis]